MFCVTPSRQFETQAPVRYAKLCVPLSLLQVETQASIAPLRCPQPCSSYRVSLHMEFQPSFGAFAPREAKRQFVSVERFFQYLAWLCVSVLSCGPPHTKYHWVMCYGKSCISSDGSIDHRRRSLVCRGTHDRHRDGMLVSVCRTQLPSVRAMMTIQQVSLTPCLATEGMKC